MDPLALLRTSRSWVLALILGVAAACDRAKPPPPVALADVPQLLRETVKDTKGLPKDIAEEVAAAVEKSDWATAAVRVQVLAGQPALTAKQKHEIARCLMTINARMAEAAASGDSQAGEVQQMRRIQK